MTIREFFSGQADLLADQLNLGPLSHGHYIQVGLGTGFYIPESAYQAAQAHANETRTVQFVGVARNGAALFGTRDEIHADPDSSGVVAWIFPQARPGELTSDGVNTWQCAGPAVTCPACHQAHGHAPNCAALTVSGLD